jgi:hypothetical protein
MTTATLPVPLIGAPTPLVDDLDRALVRGPIRASLRINGVERCTVADVDWTVSDGGERPWEQPEAGTGRFILWGLRGERFDDIEVGQSVTFDLTTGPVTLRICTHRVSEITRRLSYRTLQGVRALTVETEVLTVGPLERFGRTKISYTKGDTWLQEGDAVRARRLMTKASEGLPTHPSGVMGIAPDYFDPALLVVSDPFLYDGGATGVPRHWTDESLDVSNTWVIRPSSAVPGTTRAERTFAAGGAGSLRSLRPHMVNGLGVKYRFTTSGSATITPRLYYGTTAELAPARASSVAGTARAVAGNNVVTEGTFPNLPTGATWVRVALDISGAAAGVFAVESAKASTDAISLDRVTLKNLPDADIERKAASELFDHFVTNAHAGFFETRSGMVMYQTFARIKPKAGGYAHPIHAILECNEVLAAVTSSVQSADRINRVLVGYLDGTTEKTIVREDAANIKLYGIYEESTGGEVVGATGADLLADDFLPGTGATGTAAAPRERVTSLTTVPLDMLDPQIVKALIELPPLCCIRLDNTPRGFPASALGSWVGAVMGTELQGSSSRTLPNGDRTVNASMTLRVLDMTAVSKRPAAVVSVSSSRVKEGFPVVLSYSLPDAEIPPGSRRVWQYRRAADTAWRDYMPPAGASSWTWITSSPEPIRWRFEVVTPDGLVWDSNEVTVEVLANVRATSVILAGPAGNARRTGAIAGGVVRMSVSSSPADADIQTYFWEYAAPGAGWVRDGYTGPINSWTSWGPGTWRWRIAAQHYDGHVVYSNELEVWVGSTFTTWASNTAPTAGEAIQLWANLGPAGHGATALGWEASVDGGAWVRQGNTSIPLSWSYATPASVRWRWLEQFPDGTIIYSTVTTIGVVAHAGIWNVPNGASSTAINSIMKEAGDWTAQTGRRATVQFVNGGSHTLGSRVIVPANIDVNAVGTYFAAGHDSQMVVNDPQGGAGRYTAAGGWTWTGGSFDGYNIASAAFGIAHSPGFTISGATFRNNANVCHAIDIAACGGEPLGGDVRNLAEWQFTVKILECTFLGVDIPGRDDGYDEAISIDYGWRKTAGTAATANVVNDGYVTNNVLVRGCQFHRRTYSYQVQVGSHKFTMSPTEGEAVPRKAHANLRVSGCTFHDVGPQQNTTNQKARALIHLIGFRQVHITGNNFIVGARLIAFEGRSGPPEQLGWYFVENNRFQSGAHFRGPGSGTHTSLADIPWVDTDSNTGASSRFWHVEIVRNTFTGWVGANQNTYLIRCSDVDYLLVNENRFWGLVNTSYATQTGNRIHGSEAAPSGTVTQYQCRNNTWSSAESGAGAVVANS